MHSLFFQCGGAKALFPCIFNEFSSSCSLLGSSCTVNTNGISLPPSWIQLMLLSTVNHHSMLSLTSLDPVVLAPPAQVRFDSVDYKNILRWTAPPNNNSLQYYVQWKMWDITCTYYTNYTYCTIHYTWKKSSNAILWKWIITTKKFSSTKQQNGSCQCHLTTPYIVLWCYNYWYICM